MTRKLTIAALVFCLVGASTYSLRADVKTDEKTLVKFEGMLGRVVGIFAGKAAREGVKSSVAVRGDRMATFNDTTGNIVDLKEEKIYDIDVKKKSYKVITFAELRKQIEDAQRKAAEEMKKAQAENKTAQQPPPPSSDQKQMEVDFDLKESGQKKLINGFDTKEFVMTVTMREKGKKLEESGGLVLTSNIWEAPKVAAMSEIAAFQIKFAKAVASPMIEGASADEMASAMAMYPMMKDAISRARTESVKMNGTPILTTTTIEAVQSAEQIAASQEQQQGSTSSTPSNPTAAVGSLLGGLMKRGQKPSNTAAAAPGHATIMTTSTEVLKIGSTVVDADLSIPAGFKENK